jgi:hypothetical protein
MNITHRQASLILARLGLIDGNIRPGKFTAIEFNELMESLQAHARGSEADE